jgi:hypothetical protein
LAQSGNGGIICSCPHPAAFPPWSVEERPACFIVSDASVIADGTVDHLISTFTQSINPR